ncbi:Ig-like domain repeat protein [Streptomyces termitum]|uniref:Ig-like domain repeat protein n=1 Tax=Streptomyces termitum TaxID=67368 RepID=UPI0033B68D31
MRKRVLSAATSLAVLFSSAALVAGTAGQAAADSRRNVPVSSVGDMVVDGVHQKIFISDPSQGKIVATDYAGQVLGTFPGLSGVTGLALSADSKSLYAAVPGVDAVVVLDTETGAETARYATGEGTDPKFVAEAGGRIWFGYGTQYDGDIGSVDTSGEAPVVTLEQDAGMNYSGAPRLAVSPTDPNVLAAASSYYHWFRVGAYEVGTGTAVRTARTAENLPGGTINDLAFTPDGKRIVTAGAGNRHKVWQLSDLTQAGEYASADHGSAVAVAADGTVAAGSDAPYDPDVFVYRPGDTKPVRQYDFPSTGTSSGGDSLAPSALAWEPGGSRLFALTTAYGSSQALFHVLDEPVKSAPVVTVKAPASGTLLKALTVSGTVAATLPLPAGTPVTVTRYDAESPQGKALGTKALGANGTFSFSDAPTAAGNTTYRVAYAGDATHSAATGSAVVNVAALKPALKLDRNGHTVNFKTDVWFTATLGPTYKNRVVEIWADPYGNEPSKLLRRGTVNAEGKLAARMTLTKDTAVYARFAGDARYARAEVRSTAYTRAGVTTQLSRHYKWTKIGATWYRTYHQTTDPLVSAWHNSYPGRSTRLDLQVWYDGAWREAGSEYFLLNPNGMAYVTIGVDGAAGLRFRIRSAYIDTLSGDYVNTNAYGGWSYFNVTR